MFGPVILFAFCAPGSRNLTVLDEQVNEMTCILVVQAVGWQLAAPSSLDDMPESRCAARCPVRSDTGTCKPHEQHESQYGLMLVSFL